MYATIFYGLGIGLIFAGLFIILVAFLSLFLLETRRKRKAEGTDVIVFWMLRRENEKA